MKKIKKYSGVVVPMVTPFTEQHEIDIAAIERLTEHIIASRCHVFVSGTTGESASIPSSDKTKLVQQAVKSVAKRGLVYAGISGNCLEESVSDAKVYGDMGVDAVVATSPCYYPMTDDQYLRYFEALAERISCPLIIYNIPSTTHLSIPIHVIDKLSRHDNIVGFKDSEKGIERVDAGTKLWRNREDFSYLLGWALQSNYAVSHGADGIVPSTGNLAPAVYRGIMDAIARDDKNGAAAAQQKADEISMLYQKDRTLATSLSALKAMLSAYGLCSTQMLPPLYRLPLENEMQIRQQVVDSYGSLQQINSI